jgi:hypothetical protein
MAERILVLEGPAVDRGFLLNQAWTSEFRVSDEGGFFRLHAPSLLTTDNDEIAVETGRRLVRWLNGAAAILEASYVGVHLVEIDTVLPDGSLQRGEYWPAPLSTRTDGGWAVIKHQPLVDAATPNAQQPPIVRWVTLASRDSAVANVLEFVNAEAGRWAQLYRTVEAVRVTLGGKFAEVVGDPLDRRTELFDQSANYAQPGDLHKRHPHKGRSPKKKEMSLQDAEAHMRSVVTAFLDR